jgi:REP element-mobilizing transposase RayT
MARLARVVIPGLPHHVTQRGNGRARTFFSNANYALYRDLLAESCRAADVEVWAWCLMPNHVHLILTPSDADGLRRALAPVHRRYAGSIHAERAGAFWKAAAAPAPRPHCSGSPTRQSCRAMCARYRATRAGRLLRLQTIRRRRIQHVETTPEFPLRAKTSRC